jgi:hypothetical protein
MRTQSKRRGARTCVQVHLRSNHVARANYNFARGERHGREHAAAGRARPELHPALSGIGLNASALACGVGNPPGFCGWSTTLLTRCGGHMAVNRVSNAQHEQRHEADSAEQRSECHRIVFEPMPIGNHDVPPLFRLIPQAVRVFGLGGYDDPSSRRVLLHFGTATLLVR